MQIYLPIADLPVNVFLIFGMGLAIGFLSGMFGIGGGWNAEEIENHGTEFATRMKKMREQMEAMKASGTWN